MDTAANPKTYRMNHRHFGEVRVKEVRPFPNGKVRVEILEGENKGTSYVINPEVLRQEI